MPEISLPFPLPQELLYFLMNEYWFQETKESQTFPQMDIKQASLNIFLQTMILTYKKTPSKDKTPPLHT